MFKKILTRTAMAAAVAAGLFMAAPAAEAKVSVGIWLGTGYWHGPGYYGGHYRGWVSCGEGRWIVDHSGYNFVRTLDCVPRYYTYRGYRYGRPYIIRVDARYGRIVSVGRY